MACSSLRLVQVIMQGTEHLGEKLCTEVNDRRKGDVALSQRISSAACSIYGTRMA